MIFKDLEEQFNVKVDEIYGKFSINENSSIDPVIEIKPNDPEFTLFDTDSYSNPNNAVAMDRVRIRNFLGSSKGKEMISLQKKLQSKNPISETRKLSPEFILGNLAGEGNLRALETQKDFFLTGEGKSPGSTGDLGYAGRLQKSTSSRSIRIATGKLPASKIIDTVISKIGLRGEFATEFGTLGVNTRPELDINGEWYIDLLRNKRIGRSTSERLWDAAGQDLGRIFKDNFQKTEQRIVKSVKDTLGRFAVSKLYPIKSSIQNNIQNKIVSKYAQGTIGKIVRGIGGSIFGQTARDIFNETKRGAVRSVTSAGRDAIGRMISRSPLSGLFGNLLGSKFNINPLKYDINFIQKYYIVDKDEENNVTYVKRPYIKVNTSLESKLERYEDSLDSKYTEAGIEKLLSSIKFKYQGSLSSPASNIGIVGGFGLKDIVDISDITSYEDFQGLNSFLDKRKYYVNAGDVKSGYFSDRLNMVSPRQDTEIGDYVNLIIEEPNTNEKTHIRALISGLTETVVPSYSETPYIGRVEKNVVYNSVSRDIGFDLIMHAMSAEELCPIWEKMNYLTSLTFPIEYENGHIVPPLIKLTIGNFHIGLPGYFTTVAYTIDDETSWEIEEGNQVPHGIKVGIGFKVLELSRMQSDSKFYDYGQNCDSGSSNSVGGKKSRLQDLIATTKSEPKVNNKISTVESKLSKDSFIRNAIVQIKAPTVSNPFPTIKAPTGTPSTITKAPPSPAPKPAKRIASSAGGGLFNDVTGGSSVKYSSPTSPVIKDYFKFGAGGGFSGGGGGSFFP